MPGEARGPCGASSTGASRPRPPTPLNTRTTTRMVGRRTRREGRVRISIAVGTDDASGADPGMAATYRERKREWSERESVQLGPQLQELDHRNRSDGYEGSIVKLAWKCSCYCSLYLSACTPSSSECNHRSVKQSMPRIRRVVRYTAVLAPSSSSSRSKIFKHVGAPKDVVRTPPVPREPQRFTCDCT